MTDIKFYRYEVEDTAYAKDHTGEYTTPVLSMYSLKLKEYDLVKETNKGYWVGKYGLKLKWVPKVSKKKYAYLNKEDALVNYIERTKIHIKITENQLSAAKSGLMLAEELKNGSM